jgi:hypothetical protein
MRAALLLLLFCLCVTRAQLRVSFEAHFSAGVQNSHATTATLAVLTACTGASSVEATASLDGLHTQYAYVATFDTPEGAASFVGKSTADVLAACGAVTSLGNVLNVVALENDSPPPPPPAPPTSPPSPHATASVAWLVVPAVVTPVCVFGCLCLWYSKKRQAPTTAERTYQQVRLSSSK